MQPPAVESIESAVVAETGVALGAAPPPARIGSRALRLGYWSVVATHAAVDVFPMVIVSLMIVLQDRLGLTGWQETVVWVLTPVASGLCQPLFAWLGDRFDTRLAGPLGLAIGAVCLGSIGFAQNFWQLVSLQLVGVIGAGMYHPAAAAVAGQTGSSLRHGRAFALGIFVAAGMLGHAIAPILATRINEWYGMTRLAWLIPPALLLAVLLYASVRRVPHRPLDHRQLHASFGRTESRARWITAALLAGQNAVRFTVNTGIYILLNYWAAWRVPGDPDAAAVVSGNVTAAATIGMAAGALLAGRYVRPGAEKRAFALTAFGGAIFMASINAAGQWGVVPACIAALLASAGFVSTIPPTVGLGQRLLPSHAALVTAMLLGLGWAIGALARPLSSLLLGGARLDQAHLLSSADFDRAFIGFGVLLALAGVLALLMPARTLRAAARHS